VSLYARAKIGAEHTLLGLNGPDFHPVILRFATVFGLSPRPRFDLVINLLTAKAICEGEIPIFGGDQWRPFVHVADVARAVARCLEVPLPSVKARVFNVGGDEQNHTIAQVGDLIQRTIPKAQILKYEDSPDPRNYHVSFTRIRRELGFVPRYTVEDGIRQIAAALRSEQITEYQNKRYSNHKTLSDPGNLLSARSRHLPEFYAPALPEGVDGLPTASA
jgi:nucleoside-diphosphate-sugar epimerase